MPTTRRSTWVTRNSRSSFAVHSLPTAERTSASAGRLHRAVPDRAAACRTTLAPSSSRPPASTSGSRSAGFAGACDRGEEELVLAAEVVVHQRRVDAGGGRDAADGGAVEAALGERLARRGQDGLPGVGVPGAPSRPSRAGSCAAQLVLLRRVAAARARASRAAPATIATSQPHRAGRLGGAPDLLQRLDGVGQRQDVADRLQPAGHLVDAGRAGRRGRTAAARSPA